MALPVCVQIVTALRERLVGIAQPTYNTTPVVLPIGRSPAMQTDLACDTALGVFEQPDAPSGEEDTCGTQLITMNVVVEGVAARTTQDDQVPIALLWQDIMRAVFTADPTLGGLCIALQRGPKGYVYSQVGDGMVGVQQQINVQYFEPYGNP